MISNFPPSCDPEGSAGNGSNIEDYSDLVDELPTPSRDIVPRIRDEVLHLLDNPDVKLIAEFYLDLAAKEVEQGKVVVFENKDGSRFIGFTNLSPDQVKEMGIRTPVSNMNAGLGLAMLGHNKELDRYIGAKISN